MAAEHENVLLDMNRDQLLYGRNTEGELLTPGYLDDPYFNTEEAKKRGDTAQGWYDMKVALEDEHRDKRKSLESRYYFKVQLFPDKPSNTPNLFISGRWFYNNLFINVNQSGHSYFIDSEGLSGIERGQKLKNVPRKIARKYGYKVYGVAPQSGDFFSRGFTFPEWRRRAGFKERNNERTIG
jgi:hypothetical protein